MEIKTPAGTFELPTEFTFRELKTIKTVAGCLPAQIEEALDQGDTGIVCALVIIAAYRSGKTITEEMVLDWSITDVEFVDDDEDETADADADKKAAANPTQV
jgi:hypothetical protein